MTDLPAFHPSIGTVKSLIAIIRPKMKYTVSLVI